VDLNISLFNIPCEGVALEYVDILGNYYEDYNENIYKISLDNGGRIMSDGRA
jgi:hypothetical protein